MAHTAYLLLEDGRSFTGAALGAREIALGEVALNTSMTGYQEVLTDPASAGLLVAMTYPLIGTYGLNPADAESGRPWASGMIVREASRLHSNWRSEESLEAYLRRFGVTGITEVDTRALALHLRETGTMRAAIAPTRIDRSDLMDRIEAHASIESQDLVDLVTTTEPYDVPAKGRAQRHIVAYDFGITAQTLRVLTERSCRVTVVPASTPAETVLEYEPDGVLLSSGPGDPATASGTGTDECIHALVESGTPVLGIGLGHQLLARAFGATTSKLPNGHRSVSHPVQDLEDGSVAITRQNHGYVVRRATSGEGVREDGIEGAPELRATHLSLSDGTVEALRHRDLSAFGVQYRPTRPGAYLGGGVGPVDPFIDASDSHRQST